MVDGRHFDDAAIVKVSENLALVQTLDFFTPIVDTPFRFGQIAAANALSDVYAMGGKPQTCMAILAFPLATFSRDVVVEVLQGACDIIAEAGASLVGGHSIDDDTMKFGLSVTGYVDPQYVWSNTGARPGDTLILTKALGTGTLTAALKRREKTEDEIHEALDSMVRLNDVPARLTPDLLHAIHAATDITGFGFAGHSLQMALASQVELQIDTATLPHFALAPECLQKGFLTKAHRTNREYTAGKIVLPPTSDPSTPDFWTQLIFDPQTSGGLLLSVDPTRAAEIVAGLRPFFKATQIIGRVEGPSATAVHFR
jgi:selenide,water dikinase